MGVIGLVVSEAERPLLCPLLREANRAAAKAPWLGDDFIFVSRKLFWFLLVWVLAVGPVVLKV